MKIFRAGLPQLAVSLRSRAKLKSPRRQNKLFDRVRDQLGRVLWPGVAKIKNLVTATRSRRHHDVGVLIVDLAQQIGGNLFREIVFLGERAEFNRHSAAAQLRIRALRALSPPRSQYLSRDTEQTCRPTKSLCRATRHFVSRLSQTSDRIFAACNAAANASRKSRASSPLMNGPAQDRQLYLPARGPRSRFGLTDRHC